MIPSLVLVQNTGAWTASKETASWLAVSFHKLCIGNLCAKHKQFIMHTLWELWLKKHTTWPASWPVVVATNTTSPLLQMAPCWILALWDVKRLWQSGNLGQIAWAICSKFFGACLGFTKPQLWSNASPCFTMANSVETIMDDSK